MDMFHWVGAPKWALLVLLVTLATSTLILAYLALLRAERPILTYSRTGGIAGIRESLTVYTSGRVLVQGRIIGSKELLLGDDRMRAIGLLLKELAPLGKLELGARPGAVDFFSYSIISEEHGLELSWVDPWASEGPVPFQLEAANALMSELISEARGEEFKLRVSGSDGEVSIQAEPEGLIMGTRDRMRVNITIEGVDLKLNASLLRVSGNCVSAEILNEEVSGRRIAATALVSSTCVRGS
ncbi:MAG: hypothetical protein BA066_05165 [Candidatus Korarchaeota archaeon NZ13-K]|nr:MAG: hypothetical protein BA066_05165 [Candidatus Korarchaeota archaeon NZ13-K]